MAAGDVALAQLDDVSILAPDGDLFAYERDDGLASLVVLDDELHEILRPRRLLPGASGERGPAA
jgi:hypothetical protein